MKVFVYGSLKRGLHNHTLLREANFLKKVSVPGVMYSLGAFPGVRPTETDNTVQGELYEITEDILQSLDYLEGHPNFYERNDIQVEGDPVFIYYINPEYVEDKEEIGDVWYGT